MSTNPSQDHQHTSCLTLSSDLSDSGHHAKAQAVDQQTQPTTSLLVHHPAFSVCCYEGGAHETVNHQYLNLETRFDFSTLKFPTPLSQIPLFEWNNPQVSMNIYVHQECCKIIPIRVSKE
ncbi:hypothetical protein PR048_018600 [Dryococelus australis]|uniref:Uncharacterized protein n=1 Tax=Dryococelus australis TaxID=614101 RepID=A0ABQ9HCX8_9NEOP|nr:hypothetical protein PR048_018600 [Dryococelus australis]